jgi:hypothetical protein
LKQAAPYHRVLRILLPLLIEEDALTQMESLQMLAGGLEEDVRWARLLKEKRDRQKNLP